MHSILSTQNTKIFKLFLKFIFQVNSATLETLATTGFVYFLSYSLHFKRHLSQKNFLLYFTVFYCILLFPKSQTIPTNPRKSQHNFSKKSLPTFSLFFANFFPRKKIPTSFRQWGCTISFQNLSKTYLFYYTTLSKTTKAGHTSPILRLTNRHKATIARATNVCNPDIAIHITPAIIVDFLTR